MSENINKTFGRALLNDGWNIDENLLENIQGDKIIPVWTLKELRALLSATAEFYKDIGWLVLNSDRFSNDDIVYDLCAYVYKFCGKYDEHKRKEGLL